MAAVEVGVNVEEVGFEGVSRRSLSLLGSHSIRPALPRVQNPRDLDGIAANSIRHQIGCPADDKLSRSFDPALPPHLWVEQQTLDRGQDQPA